MTESSPATPEPVEPVTVKRTGPLRKLTKSQIKRALAATAGNVTRAAFKLCCNKNTIYQAFKRWPELNGLRADVRESFCDLCWRAGGVGSF